MIRTDATLRIALGEYDIGWHDPHTSLDRAAALADVALSARARLLVLPEMCTSGFTMDAGFAEPLEGESVQRLSDIARSRHIWMIAGVPTSGLPGSSAARNSALVLDPDGNIAARYDKQKLFAYASEHESYEPGSAPVVIDVEGLRIAPFICYDLRFPEVFRAVAADVDAMVLIASWPAARRSHWDALLPARAIENQCYFIGVNRTGNGGRITYDGGSAAYDPWGTRLVPDTNAAGGVPTVQISSAEVRRVRESYPFLADATCP